MAKKAKAETRTRRTRNAKKEKDPTAPKRNKSAYLFFCDAGRPEVKKDYPDMKMTEVSKELARRWKALSDDEKKPYLAQAEADKTRYLNAKEAHANKKKKAVSEEDEESESD